MKLMKNLRWAAIALGILGGSTNAFASACVVTPDSILTEGQTLQLVADCGTAKVQTINWKMAIGTGTAVTVTGDIVLAQPTAKKIYFTTPVGLTSSGTGEYTFSVVGTSVSSQTPDDLTTAAADSARVVVTPSSAALALAQGVNPVTPVDASCGTPPGTALQSMPTGTAQCSLGSKAALAISGPNSFTWSCLSLTGGAEANCYGVRGYTVTATDNGSLNGSISPASQGVASGGTVSVTAAPTSGYSAAISGCGGTQSGNNFTTGPVTANCTVTATFTNSPTAAACGSANGVASLTAPSTGLCATGTLLGSVASGTGQFTWTCDGPNGGADASCTAPMQYTVTAALSGTGGAVNAPTSKTVTHNGTTSFTVTPEGTNVASVSGCGASVSGNTVTTGAITGACTVTVSFGLPVTGISANGVTMPGTVKEVTTALPVTRFSRYVAAPVNGDEVYSFQMTVPGGTGQLVRTLSTTKQTAMVGQKRVTISEYRGDYDTTGKPSGCTGVDTQVVSLTAIVNYPTASTTKYCHLTPGKTYWVNVSSRFNKDNATTCSTSGNCGFYFESN